MTEIDDWVFESVLQFLKSPVWTTPIHGFIEQHCQEFSSEEEENKLIYTELHKKFSELVDSLLSTFLEELGVSVEAFVEAVKRNNVDVAEADTPAKELSVFISEYILALDDFPSFRAMMEKKNVEMDLEAMYEYVRYTSAARDEMEDMSDEERFLYEMAIHMSLGAADLTLKELEAEDAELLQALALSVAAEQERLLREQLAAEGEETEAIKAMKEEVRAKRVENVERVVREIQASPQKPAREAVVPPKPASAAALAPIGARRSAPGGFTISNPAVIAKAETPAAPQPSFEDLRKQAEEKLKTPAVSQPTKEELEQRAEYFRKQREMLVKSKQAERDAELKKFQANPTTSGSDTSSSAQPLSAPTGSDSKSITVALARRLKEDLINESRK